MDRSKGNVDFYSKSINYKEYFFNSFFFIASFWFLNQIAYLFTLNEGLSVFYPPSGFAMLLIYLLGPRYLPVHFLAIIIGGLPQRDIFNYSLEMLSPDLRQFIIYGTAGLILRKVNPKKEMLDAIFFYSIVVASIVTALISAVFFIVDLDQFHDLTDATWLASTSSFFIGNLTGALTALPIFIFYLHARVVGWDTLKAEFEFNFLKLDKIFSLFFLLGFIFLIILLGKVDASFSNFYYFMLIPMILSSVKWGLNVGLAFVFVGNIFALALYIFFGYSNYGVLEVQIMFAVSIMSTIFIGLLQDKKNTLYKQSMYDELTGLANVRLFRNLSHSMIANAHRNGEKCAFLFVDIDGFKAVNDTYGHKIGDDLLKQIGERINNCLRESDFLARLGGDEFIIQLYGNISEEGAETVALNTIENISKPFYFDNCVATVGASIGISIYPKDGTDIDILISKADKAMYAAKNNGKNCHQLHGHGW